MTNPTDTTQALARGARNGGAKIIEMMKVSEILTANGRAIGAETDQDHRGRRRCLRRHVVPLCAAWRRRSVACRGALHIVTRPMEGVVHNQPVLRDMDGYIYIKEGLG